MKNGSQPATKQDLLDLENRLDKRFENRFATKQDLQGLEKCLELRFATKQDLERFATKEDLVTLKDELVEAFHDAETMLLNGFYGFLETARKRFADLDRNDFSLRERLDTVEKRLTELERKVLFPDFNPPASS